LRLHAFQRDKSSKNTPFKFSWKFLVQDNLIRIITSIATVLENTLGVQLHGLTQMLEFMVPVYQFQYHKQKRYALLVQELQI
jgi:hypothetical protein